jgi:predicted component of type VI protein secretion system
MTLIVEVLDGPQKGITKRLFEGFKIGRSNCDLTLTDKKISSVHAKIEMSSNGRCYLVDQQSSNGIVLDGKKIERLLLKPGLKFKLGNVHFQVREMGHLELNELKKENWLETLIIEVPLLAGFDEPVEELTAYERSLSLQFKTGLQAGDRFLVSYGPRTFGRQFCDFILLDALAPDSFFKISSVDNDFVLSNLSDQEIKINSNSVSEAVISNGDQLAFGETLIEVQVL